MIAGEPSGDLHGSGVVHELKKRMPGVAVFGVGGDKMLSEGMELVHHISSLSFMGFVEVIKHLSHFLLRILQRNWPATRITWIIGKTEAGLINDIPDVEFMPDILSQALG